MERQHTSSRWRRMAEEYRTLADGATHQQARAVYIRLADEADGLASRLAETEAAIARSTLKSKPHYKPH